MEWRVVSLADRRSQTAARIKQLRAELKETQAMTNGKACVYATGSFGRGEASRHSDLDVFILGKTNNEGKRQLSQLNETCVKSELIHVTRSLGIPEFDGDGQYLEHFSVDELIRTLGTQHDDVTNTFTARLLLLLESRPLVQENVYEESIREVIASYWRDYGDHKNDFIPAFFTNDILRLWRTFCVNYEARTSSEPEEKKAKRKLKNYKLKHSRLLTCYSGILQLLAQYEANESVSPTDALEMIKLTPTERLEWLLNQSSIADAHETIRKLLDQYELFLDETNYAEHELISRFMDSTVNRRYAQAAYQFGDLMFGVLDRIGQDNRFHRLLVV
jgi:predicted nucleotidyltransferase